MTGAERDAKRDAKHRQLAEAYADILLRDVAAGTLDRELCVQLLLNYASVTRNDHVAEIIDRLQEGR